jgi:hypothetical protein
MAPDQWFGMLTDYRSRSTPKLRQPAAPAPDAGKSRCIFLRRDESKQLLVFCLSKIAVVNARLRVSGSRDSATVRGWATGTAARAIRQSFVQDTFDGAGAAAALDIAAEAAVDFVRGQRLRPRGRYHVAHLVVAKHVA